MRVFFTLTVLLAMLAITRGQSQNSVVIGTMVDKPNALLVLNPPDANQGFLVPQLPTGSRRAMSPSSSEDGLIVFDIDEKEFYHWKNGQWVKGLGGTAVAGAPAAAVQYYSLDPADFRSVRNTGKKDHDNGIIFEENPAFITVFKKNEANTIMAALHLPDGAELLEVTLYYMDKDPTNITLDLYRKPFAGTDENVLPSWNSVGSSATIQSSSHAPIAGKQIIDNSSFTYRLVVQLNATNDTNDANDADLRIYGVKIKYIK